MLTIDRSMMLVTAPSIPIGVDVSTPLQAHEKAAMRIAKEPCARRLEMKDFNHLHIHRLYTILNRNSFIIFTYLTT